MSHKGQGNYFDTEFNIDGTRQTHRRATTRTSSPTTPSTGSQATHDKPWLLMLGHKAPHGGPIQPEPKYAHAFDAFPVRKPATTAATAPATASRRGSKRASARGTAPRGRSTTSKRARHVRPDVPRDDALGRRQRRPALRDAADVGPARRHRHRLHQRQRLRHRRARPGRQADDVRGEHPGAAAGALPAAASRRARWCRRW